MALPSKGEALFCVFLKNSKSPLYIKWQSKAVKTRNGDLANPNTESEVICMKDFLKEDDSLLKMVLICLLLSLLALLTK